MSRHRKFDFERVRRVSIHDRRSKVQARDLGSPVRGGSLSDYLESLPHLLAARDLRFLVRSIGRARQEEKPIIWGFGGHVIKAGLGPILRDLMERGFVTHLATNCSGLIHDFEICLWGGTSEDVDRELGSGGFGVTEETGRLLNKAINEGVSRGLGLGEAVVEFLGTEESSYSELSLLSGASRLAIPVTSHIAIGTDVIHCHPDASGRYIGEGSFRDFQVFVESVSRLHGGGVYLNLGSAVVLPEVFLKAVAVIRSSGLPLEDLVTANLDFIQHYRPYQNVVRRPVLDSGTGISLTGHHEIMIPLLAGLLVHGSF